MYARESYSAEEFPKFIVSSADDGFEPDNFFAGEPVCARTSRRREIVPYTSLFLILAVTVGCAFASDADTRSDWTSKIERVAASLEATWQTASASTPSPSQDVSSIATPPPAAPAPPAAVAAAQPLPVVTVTTAPGDAPDASDTNGEKTSDKPHVSDAYAPPQISSDAYGRKAEAVGLHPDLSRAVLSRLTPADYRNAAYAIQKAIKTIPNDGEFIWPRAHKSGFAVFNVHFVQGAGRDCRRYVVTIPKDRWTSTALPMEKCGVKVAFRATEKEKSIE